VLPSTGATLDSVTMSLLRVMQQVNGGQPIDLGNQLNAAFMVMLSALTSSSPSSPQWDFDLIMEPTFFLITETYYLEATLELTFANTGPLTRTVVLKRRKRNAAAMDSPLAVGALSDQDLQIINDVHLFNLCLPACLD
jgi:hypothetical protein